MTDALDPTGEARRLVALRRLEVLDSPREEALDDLVALAADLFDVPIALVSLVDRDRQWFKAAKGIDLEETPRDLSFCAHTIPDGRVLVVEDAREDDRFRSNALVTASPHIRFYAGAPLITNEGDVLGTVCVIDRRPRTLSSQQRDVLTSLARHAMTRFELQATARELRESEERFRTLFENAPVGVFVTDGDGSCRLVNPAWCEITGMTRADASGRGWMTAIHPDDRAGVEREWLDTVSTERGFDAVYRVRRPSGENRHVASRAAAIASGGSVAGFVGTVHDITDRERAAEERAIAEAHVREAVRRDSLSLLAGGIAHDFNNVLTSIMGNLVLLDGDLPGDGAGAVALTRVRAGLESAADLTRQLLDFTGRGGVVKRPVDLEAITRRIHHLVAAPSSASPDRPSVTMSLEVEPALPAVHADSSQLQQVVLNLLTNAIQAVGEERQAVIRTRLGHPTPELLRRSSVHGARDRGDAVDRWLALSVSDNGVGIPPDVQPRIFDPFFTSKPAGRGLGLAAVYGIVTGHDGAILVDSAPGAGTTFTVLLPAADACTPDVQGGLPEGAALTALVVDDHPAVRSTARAMLERSGHTVLEADNGLVALDIVEAAGDEIDVILLDLVMPGPTGEETLAELARRGCRIPVVLTSGRTAEQLDLCAHGPTPAAFLAKPYASGSLLHTVRVAAAGARPGTGRCRQRPH